MIKQKVKTKKDIANFSKSVMYLGNGVLQSLKAFLFLDRKRRKSWDSFLSKKES